MLLLAPISSLMALASAAVRCARLRTSVATTAKPRPCSPARAASTAALSARMLVWKAMPSITPMMSAIFWLLALMSCMVRTTCDTTSPPCAATRLAPTASWLAWLALSALWRMVAPSCSMLAAVSSSALAWLSVRPERSWLPYAISVLAADTLSALVRTVPRLSTRRTRNPSMAWAREPISSRERIDTSCVRSPCAR